MARVIVFTMRSCGHCAEYLPRFRRAAGHARFSVVDVQQNPALARRFGVDATPTTVVERRDGSGWKQVGSVSDAGIARLLDLARRA